MEPRKPSVEELAAMPYRDWATAAATDNRTTNQPKVVGNIDSELATLFKEHGLKLSGTDIEITGRNAAHLMRDSKAERGAAVSMDDLLDLPRVIASPKAVLFDTRNKNVLYIFDTTDSDGRLGKFVVEAGYRGRFMQNNGTRKTRKLNQIVTAGLVPRYNLEDTRYVLLRGSL
jgi:hypothetical protein